MTSRERFLWGSINSFDVEGRKKSPFNICMKDVSFRCSSSIAFKNFKRVVAISSSAQKVLRQQNSIFLPMPRMDTRTFRSIKSLKQKFQFSSLHSRTIDFEQLCAEARFNFNEIFLIKIGKTTISSFSSWLFFLEFLRDTSRKLKTITKRKQF